MNLRLIFSAMVAGCLIAALVTSPTFAASMGPGSGGGVSFPLQAPADDTFAYGWSGDTNNGIKQNASGEITLQSKGGTNGVFLIAENTAGTQTSTLYMEQASSSLTSGEIALVATNTNGVGITVLGQPMMTIGGTTRVGTMPIDFSALGGYVGTSPTAFPTCNSSNRGMFGYREDTDTTANNPALCLCSRDTGALTYSWKVISGTGACL